MQPRFNQINFRGSSNFTIIAVETYVNLKENRAYVQLGYQTIKSKYILDIS